MSNEVSHVKDVMHQYNNICRLIRQVLPDDEAVPHMLVNDTFVKPYFMPIEKDPYELVVQLELLDSSMSMKDLVVFNAVNAMMTGRSTFQLSIPAEAVAEVFDIDVLFAYAVSLVPSSMHYVHPIDSVLQQISEVDSVRPTLLAKLFVSNPDDFVNAIKISESVSLACKVQRLFEKHLAIDKALFGIVLKKWQEKMHNVRMASMHMH